MNSKTDAVAPLLRADSDERRPQRHVTYVQRQNVAVAKEW